MPLYNDVRIAKNQPAVMRDGVTLHANIYRPDAEGSFPALLTRLPYGKDLFWSTSYLDPVQLAQRGYVVIEQDVRGRFASEGEWTPFEHEFTDGYDTVEWAASLPWCNGRVAMWGASYFGMTQWQAAVMQPPALRGLALGTTWSNYLNGTMFRGGVREWGLMEYWCQLALAPNTLLRKHAHEPQVIMERLPALVQLIDELPERYHTLPLTAFPDPSGTLPYVYDWLRRPVNNPYWHTLSIDHRMDQVTVPTLHIGGWYDAFCGETLRNYQVMVKQAAQNGLPTPHLVMAPWSHGMFGNVVGDIDFGLASSGAFLNYQGTLTDLHLRYFNALFYGETAAWEARPPVELFVMGENRWRGFASWPPADATVEHWYLHSGGSANTAEGDGWLSRQEPDEEPADQYRYDPLNPVPTIGGPVLMPALYRPGARDQRPNEARQDVLCYTSKRLERPLTAIGPVSITLYASTTAVDTDWVARLIDVDADGRAINVTDGVLRASTRHTYPRPGVIEPAPPEAVEPGRVYAYTIDMWATAMTFGTGHHLRVEVTSSNFPRWERNLNTGADNAASVETLVATQQIMHAREYPSVLQLSVLP
ncbi:MAG: CocE/NonD family hydrolase [Herpetosiphon sp.]